MMSSTLLASPAREVSYTDKILSTTRDGQDRPLFVQIAGNKPAMVATAGRVIERNFGADVDALDLNFGCPQHCAKRGGYGAFVLDDADTAVAVVQALSAAVRLPVTCKIRVLPSIADTVRLARRMVAAGCQVLTVHGRTRQEKGPATANCDWDSIAAVRRAVRVPVIANGGVATRFDAELCMRSTGAHACMASEALLEDPAMFGRALTPQEAALLPPHDLWRAIEPRPWEEARQHHLVLLREHRSIQKSHVQPVSRKRPAAASGDGDDGDDDDGGGDDDGAGSDGGADDGADAAAAGGAADGSPESETAKFIRSVGIKPVAAEAIEASNRFLRAVPVGPAAGEALRRAGPDALTLASEYVELCARHGCQLKEARNHVFKILFGLLATNHDLRRALDRPPAGARAVMNRERRLISGLKRKLRTLGTMRRFYHLPHSRGANPAPPPVIASQLATLRHVLAALRARVDAGWPLLAVRGTPSGWGKEGGATVQSVLPTQVTCADPSEAVLGMPELDRSAAEAALREQGCGFWWTMRDPEASGDAPALSVVLPSPDGAAPSAAPGAASGAASEASLPPPEDPWADPPKSGEAPSIADVWPGADAEAVGRTIRRWPPVTCRDVQRRPGLPLGLDATLPGLWYWRHLFDPMDAKITQALCNGPTATALSRARAAGQAQPFDIDPEDFPSPAELCDEDATGRIAPAHAKAAAAAPTGKASGAPGREPESAAKRPKLQSE
ncbi:hypothetical protein FNF29_07301 [Cafeteria roenbergensis]|uniref:tRNA-dihydrouridine(16/17) synthase [NAD(P)(+)] n=1 Tax=Cafeteria roenbergensis TaxID=33653 RepID=A0A5A8C3D4_CAFRO|nr:hypothetical protein FNF29_07301 [Cafeteria roenbergensis]|eukprot:KAA0147556.1 hypothetical protein FNF29_07301 [Cafeteria roenbergensis]